MWGQGEHANISFPPQAFPPRSLEKERGEVEMPFPSLLFLNGQLKSNILKGSFKMAELRSLHKPVYMSCRLGAHSQAIDTPVPITATSGRHMYVYEIKYILSWTKPKLLFLTVVKSHFIYFFFYVSIGGCGAELSIKHFGIMYKKSYNYSYPLT